MTSTHHTVVDGPYLQLVAPAGCAGDEALVAAAELDADVLSVTARIDGGSAIALTRSGGWTWRAPLPTLGHGSHDVVLEARSRSGTSTSIARTFATCALDSLPDPGADWPEVGGGADHAGARASELDPPLVVRWTQTLGGHALQASPVIAGGVVYVSVTDLADGGGGGVVAMELATGAILWRAATAMPVRGAPAVVGSTLVVAQVDGRVLGFDIRSGLVRWDTDLGAGLRPQAAAIFASVTADQGDALVGNQNAFGPLSGQSGAPRWLVDPVLTGRDSQSFSAIAVADNIAVGVFNRAIGGVIAWDRSTGDERWRVAPHTVAINATPIIADGTVYVVNGRDEVLALDLASGNLRWKVALDPAGFDWGNATIGAPALAAGILLVPTLYRDVVALDAATGTELWRFAGTPSPLHTTHYRGAKESGFEASPVITGGIAWLVDTAGVLSAIELSTGKLVWQTAFGVPVLAGPATSGDWLVIASFDGTVRALSPGAPNSESTGGCCDSGGNLGGSLVLVMIVALALTHGYRATCRRPCR